MNQILNDYLFNAFASASDNTFVYVSDMKEDLTRWSKQAVDYFGLPGEYLKNCKEVWLEHIHPDDRKVYVDDITAVFSGQSEHHNCQYRARNRYGEYVWIECKGSVTRDEEGNASVFASIMTRIDNQTKYDNLTHLLTGYELCRTPFCKNGSLMIIGIDNFRNINSQHGILYGNRVLVRLAEIISEEVDNMYVYRYQGDEFAVYGEDKSPRSMSILFKRILKRCTEVSDESKLVAFSVSAGIAEGTANADPEDVIAKAELSLLYAKQKNSSHVSIYSKEIEEKQNRKNLVSEELLKCIDNDFEGFHLVYQPILDNTGKTVVACESLLRWETTNENIGKCFPDEFIPILEKNGGITKVGYFVMHEAIKQASIWQKNYKKFNVSFNVSYLQLEDPLFVPDIIKTVEKYKLDTKYIVLELTESILEIDTVMVTNYFKILRKYGIKIALDDFGTGNSSFWMLHNIDVDIVKLDQSFIRGLEAQATKIDCAIVESVGIMCKRIGCKTIAEGVETENIWNMISKFKFSGLQGYLFSRPVKPDKFEDFLNKYEMVGLT